ncbi:UNVERIFIED_CONTAM: hypothetical protein K2H54_038299 [Gekko kuhli]
MEGSMVRRTQELLGRVIRKPPLTERLLSRPPFRYLHDVIGEVIRSTGFMKGLYTESEMKSDNVKDKEAKIAFLQKAIDVVVMVTGESLAVKPARIVAGHEPERTNELLQAIAKCCLNKLSSDDAVQKVLAGEKVDVKGKTPSSSKSQNKESKESKAEEHRSHKEGGGLSEIKDKGTSQDQKPKEEPKEAESKRKEKESDKSKDYENKQKNHDKDSSKEGEKHNRERAKNKTTGSEESVMKKTEERSMKDKAELGKEDESPGRLSKQHSTKGSRHRARTGSEGESVSDAEGDALNTAVAPEKMVAAETSEIANEPPPPSASLRRLPRPSSARPAPPRIKRQESAEVLLPERNGSARIVSNVIIDKKEEEEEEDDQFVVEAASEVPEMTEMATEVTVELEGDEKHGGLVKRILETKKDYEQSQVLKSAEKEKPLLYESARRKEKDLVSKEVEKFRGSIQALCRSALPLGKLMDYIQEDMDAIKNEYQMWKNENKQLTEALQKEQSITESAVEPLKAKLVELDQLIKDEQDKICAKRATVLKNDEKIRKMILNINSRK